MRRLGVALVIVVGLGLAIGGGYMLARTTTTEQSTVETIPTETVEVVRTDLVQTDSLDGTLGYGEPETLTTPSGGTVTAIPEEASRLERGAAAFEIDGQPVIVLRGERPAWRPLDVDSENGPDIAQLETNLAALGFGPEEWDTDEEWDSDTDDAVEAWRDDLGLSEGLSVELGRVVFLADDVRVGDILVETGDLVMPGAAILEYTGFEQLVTIELDPDRLDLVAVDDPVSVTLPDDSVVAGAVSEVGRVVVPSGPEPDAPGVIDVVITLAEPINGLDQAPVEVEIETERATGVLAVPVRALTALSDGGYAVEIGGDLVAVEIGNFADGLVEVAGALQEGDDVVVPQ